MRYFFGIDFLRTASVAIRKLLRIRIRMPGKCSFMLMKSTTYTQYYVIYVCAYKCINNILMRMVKYMSKHRQSIKASNFKK